MNNTNKQFKGQQIGASLQKAPRRRLTSSQK